MSHLSHAVEESGNGKWSELTRGRVLQLIKLHKLKLSLSQVALSSLSDMPPFLPFDQVRSTPEVGRCTRLQLSVQAQKVIKGVQ